MIPKFRAWMKSLKWMCDVTNISFDSKLVDICQQGDTERCTEISVEFDEIELMQSTGLFDRNGKEVFIGDIVKCTRGCSHEVYLEKEYGGTFIGGMPAIYLKGLLSGYAWTEDDEIIGNIYENPELLEVKE
uniref:YopX protein n=1 Tax=Siphoviridae sp. ctR6G4 TaxID=2825499 RepID=A0A8S5NZV2_9CAUD|nr:MAG TPA: YopX protein [Siphoviridae sp. ctR6G4]